MTLHRRTLLATFTTALGAAMGTLPLTRAARAGVAQGAVARRLTLLHYNDFHSRHDPVDARALSCDGAKGGCFGGSSRLASAIRAQRAAAEADGRIVVLLDGGDQFQGSLFFTKYKGMAELAVQHAVGTDAMGVGNHEFDAGPGTLAAYLARARFPVVSSNVDASAEPALAGRIRPWALLERGGLRIGVVGLTTLDTPVGSSPGPNVRFLEPGPALARAVAEVRAAGAGFVVLLSHMGVSFDRALAAAGVSVVIGGHSHTLLSSSEVGAFGAYPSADVAGALVVQAGAYGRYLGRLDVDLDGDGQVIAHGGDCVHVGLELSPDPEVAGIVAGYAAPLEGFRHEVVAVLPEELSLATCRIAQCGLGRMVAEAMLADTHGSEVAVMNAGGIRTGLPAGRVTRGQVLEALPYGNAIATMRLLGADLAEAVQVALGKLGGGGFPQLAGMRLGAAGFEVRLGDGWEPLEPRRMYAVVTNDFLRRGGDGYSVFRDRAVDAYDLGPGLDDAFVGYLGGR